MVSFSCAAVDKVALMPGGPSTLRRLTQTFSALPPLNTILGASVAVTVFTWPSCSTMQLAVCECTQNLVSAADKAATIVARLISMCTVQRASPDIHLTLCWSPSLIEDLAKVFVSEHM